MTSDQLREAAKRITANKVIDDGTQFGGFLCVVYELARAYLDRKPEPVNERLLKACKSLVWACKEFCGNPRLILNIQMEQVPKIESAIAAAEQAKAEAALPITEEWLESVGFTFNGSMLSLWIQDTKLFWTPEISAVQMVCIGRIWKTRGQLLNLLAALKGG